MGKQTEIIENLDSARAMDLPLGHFLLDDEVSRLNLNKMYENAKLALAENPELTQTPSPISYEFLKKLGQCSNELGQHVSLIKKAYNQLSRLNQFVENPFKRDKEGNLVFLLNSTNESDGNLLESFDSIKDISEYLDVAKENFDIEDSSGNWIKLLAEYTGPKVMLLPDTNVLIKPQGKSRLDSLVTHPAIVKGTLGIINQEAMHGGLRAKYGETLPLEVARGQMDLESRCGNGFDSVVSKEVSTLFDCIEDYFNREVAQVSHLINFSNMSDSDIANEMSRRKKGKVSEDYFRMTKNLAQKIREGDNINYVGDKVLASAGFGLNLVEPGKKRVVMSYDKKDMAPLFEIFYREILPQYMARTANEIILENNPELVDTPNYNQRLIEASKEHIKWALNDSPNKTAVGIYYSPADDKIHTYNVATPFVEYFQGNYSCRHGKSRMLSEMIKTGDSPEKVIDRLMSGKYSEGGQ